MESKEADEEHHAPHKSGNGSLLEVFRHGFATHTQNCIIARIYDLFLLFYFTSVSSIKHCFPTFLLQFDGPILSQNFHLFTLFTVPVLASYKCKTILVILITGLFELGMNKLFH